MKVLDATFASLVTTASQVLASQGGADGESPRLLMMLFLGFGALILVFQVFTAIMLLSGMLKGMFSAAGKSLNEAMAGNDGDHS